MKATTLNIVQGTIQDVRYFKPASLPTKPSLLEITSDRIYNFFDTSSQALSDTWKRADKSE
jgi:hypothetical protein